MAVTIKLKQGSGSDPSASDLVAGEPAVRTDTGEIFLKKDDGSVAKVSGGVDDGDKGDITVSSSGATWTIDNDAVTYAKIQNVSATDRILGRDSSGAGVIEEITPANLRTMLGLASSATTDTTNASNISSGTLAAARVATLNQDTTGNAATATALETARTIAGVSFDGSANISLNNNAITNGAGYITATLTQEQVEDYVGNMVQSNTETGITVTYQDSDGTLDFVVASQTENDFTDTLKNKLDGIAASATNVTNNNQITNGAGYVTSSIINSLNASNLDSGTVATARLGSGTANSSSYLRGDNTWATISAGAEDGIFWENGQNVTSNYTITNGKNAMSAGPITIDSGVTVTVGSGETWTVV